MKYKKYLIWIASIALLLVVGVLLSQPVLLKAVYAKYKSTDHFAILPEDARIRYESKAKDNAIAVKEILDGSQMKVESILRARFMKPIGVYVCASQDSFNDYVPISKNVRGAVYWGKVFLSPGAFSYDEKFLAELTSHELTHYLFYTHLGDKTHVDNVPLWFREGIAVFVANGGAEFTKDQQVFDLISSEEREAFLSGKIDFWFASKDPRDAVAKNGAANWLLYRVGALFVHQMRDSNPAGFDTLIQLLLSGTEFNEAVKDSYGKNVESLLAEFSQYLTTKNASMKPAD